MLKLFNSILIFTVISACSSTPPGPNRIYPEVPFENLNQYFSGSIAKSDININELALGNGACVLVYFAVEESGEVVDPGIGAFSGIGTLKQSLFPDVVARLNATKLDPVPGQAKQISTAKVFGYFKDGTSAEDKAAVEQECAQFI